MPNVTSIAANVLHELPSVNKSALCTLAKLIGSNFDDSSRATELSLGASGLGHVPILAIR